MTMLETTIKVSKGLRKILTKEKKDGETYNELIIAMHSRLKSQGWRCNRNPRGY